LSYDAWLYSEKINLQKKNKIETTDADKDVESMNYWIFSPGSQAINWDAFYKKGLMAIGWEELEDFSMRSEERRVGKSVDLGVGRGIRNEEVVKKRDGWRRSTSQRGGGG